MNLIDIHDLQRWVGRQAESTQSLDPFPARALAAALDRVDALPADGTLPLPWHWLYFLDTPTSSGTGADGHPTRGGFLPPVPLPRRMWAAGRLRVMAPLVLGQPAYKTSRIASVDLKEGKTGALVFVNLEHTLQQRGMTCLVEEQNIVYRDMPVASAPLPATEAAATDADWETTILPDPVLLFRFSALTYNGHRIHYDRDYAVQHEFYPALVVHGPLLATWLLDLLRREVRDATVSEFRFRAVRPTFDTDVVRVCGKRDGMQVMLWTANTQGFVGMTARATLS
ncbi:MAG TPA: MaoC family dehydratase N-terminal domain-containing protein [Burkholderiaceae bacterium]|nr:MaoC family dehydratase N-terminal domain-containing protein [Burkholderiaceae bacterium]